MKKAMVLFQRHGAAWDPAKPVREQALWDEHARFVDALYDQGKILLARGRSPTGRARWWFWTRGARTRHVRGTSSWPST